MKDELRFSGELNAKCLGAKRNLAILAGTVVLLYFTNQHGALEQNINLGVTQLNILEYVYVVSLIAIYNMVNFHISSKQVRQEYRDWRSYWDHSGGWQFIKDKALEMAKESCGYGHARSEEWFGRVMWRKREQLQRDVKEERWRARRDFLWWDIWFTIACFHTVIFLGPLVNVDAIVRDFSKYQANQQAEIGSSPSASPPLVDQLDPRPQ